MAMTPTTGAHAQQVRLAPTAKIPDDAPLAPPTRPVAALSPHVSYAPPAMPGTPSGQTPAQPGLTTRPGGHQAPVRASSEVARVSGAQAQQHGGVPTGERPRVEPLAKTPLSNPSMRQSGPSMSFTAPPQRSMALIVVVLLIDLGLAATGAFLLMKGLEKPAPAAPTKASAPTTGEAPAPAAATAAVATAPSVPAAVAPVPAPAPEPADGPATTKTAAARTPAAPPARASTIGAAVATAGSAAVAPPASAVTSTPITTSPAEPAPTPAPAPTPSDPPATPAAAQPPSTDAEVNALAAKARPAFDQCRGDQAVTGSINIAFRTHPDGSVKEVAPVENTTGNGALASCLVGVISGWHVSPYSGAPLSFLRSFNYQ